MTKTNSLVDNFDATIHKNLQAALEKKASTIKCFTKIINEENTLKGFSLSQQHLTIEREPYPRAEREEEKWFEPIYRISFIEENPQLENTPKKWNFDVYINDEKPFQITQYDGKKHDLLQQPSTQFKQYTTELEAVRNLLKWVEDECDSISVNLALKLSEHLSSNLEHKDNTELFSAWSMADRTQKQSDGWVRDLLRGNGDSAISQEMIQRFGPLKEGREIVKGWESKKQTNTRTPK